MQPWVHAKPGQKVVVRGTITEYSSPFVTGLENCAIIDISGEANTPQISTSELGQLYADGDHKQFDSKLVWLSGPFQSYDPHEKHLYLGDDKQTHLIVQMEDGQHLTHLEPGSAIEVLGEVFDFPRDDNLLLLIHGLLLSPLRKAVSVDPPRIVEGIPLFTVDELASTFRSEPTLFLMRYHDQPIRVQGKVAEYNLGQLKFQSTSGNTFFFYFYRVSEIGELLPGQEVIVEGQFQAIGPENAEKSDSIDFNSSCKLLKR